MKPSQLQQELKQNRPFGSLEEEAFLNIVRTSDALVREFERLFRKHGLTLGQYNVLRILRGAGRNGISCREIGERLISEVPDVTRLLNRMEANALLTRERFDPDRRVVVTRITPAALDLLSRLDPQVAQLHREQMSHVPAAGLRSLIRTLESTRQRQER